MWERGEKLPSQIFGSMMTCRCGVAFDSHDPEGSCVHRGHIYAAPGCRWYSAVNPRRAIDVHHRLYRHSTGYDCRTEIDEERGRRIHSNEKPGRADGRAHSLNK
jgi:hypothetical protein